MAIANSFLIKPQLFTAPEDQQRPALVQVSIPCTETYLDSNIKVILSNNDNYAVENVEFSL